jgi:hypothetical protein
MSDTKANAQPTSLSEVYAKASALQIPAAPPTLSAAIMQAAAQAASVRSAGANASVAAPVSTAPIEFAVPESVTAKPSLPSGESWREGLALLQQLIQAAATRLQNIFAIPTLRYGLPAMMVAAVGFKIALPDAPTIRDSAAPAVASAAAAPAAASAEIVAASPTKPASTPTSSVAKTVLNKIENSENKIVSSNPSGLDETAAKNRTVLTDSSNKETWSETKGKDNAQTAGKAAMELSIELPRQPQAFPAERDNAAVPAAPAPVAMPAALSTALVARSAPAAAPAMKMQARPALEASSVITNEQRLRGLIATNREVDGRVQEACNTAAPKLEQVQSWLTFGASPNYVLNGVSTLALAQRCGFTEAAREMQQAMQSK